MSFALIAYAGSVQAASLTTLWNFQLQTGNGIDPVSGPGPGVVIGAGGVLYVSTAYGGTTNEGTVVKLTPPVAPKTAWSEQVIFSMPGGAGGSSPSTLIVDAKGALYATAAGGSTTFPSSGCGLAFRIVAPASAKAPWAETVLHTFEAGKDGCRPAGGLALGAGGFFYGTTIEGGGAAGCGAQGTFQTGCGTVYVLVYQTKPGPWKEGVLYRLTPSAGLAPLDAPTIDPDDPADFYFATNSSGTSSTAAPYLGALGPGIGYEFESERDKRIAFEIVKGLDPLYSYFPNNYIPAPPTTPRPHSLAAAATPVNVLVGTSTTNGDAATGCPASAVTCSDVFTLTRPSSGTGTWTPRVLHNFTGGTDGSFVSSRLLVATSGVIYGTTRDGGTAQDGTIFSFTPNTTSPTGYSYAIVHAFTGKDGARPGGLVEYKGVIYGTTAAGGTGTCSGGCGTVFAFHP